MQADVPLRLISVWSHHRLESSWEEVVYFLSAPVCAPQPVMALPRHPSWAEGHCSLSYWSSPEPWVRLHMQPQTPCTGSNWSAWTLVNTLGVTATQKGLGSFGCLGLTSSHRGISWTLLHVWDITKGTDQGETGQTKCDASQRPKKRFARSSNLRSLQCVSPRKKSEGHSHPSWKWGHSPWGWRCCGERHRLQESWTLSHHLRQISESPGQCQVGSFPPSFQVFWWKSLA